MRIFSFSAFLQESDDFMNAMNAAIETQKELLRKRKKPTKNDDGTSPTPKTGADNKEVKPAFKVRFLAVRSSRWEYFYSKT